MTDLRTRILPFLKRRSKRWYTGLAAELATARWRDLVEIGLDPENYGTARMLARDANAPRIMLSPQHSIPSGPFLEGFDATMRRRYVPLNLVPLDGCHINAATARLSRAIKLVDEVPPVRQVVAALARAVHLIATEGSEFDSSYSDPTAPFSVFIGLHHEATRTDALRLAESLVHESMHLQLSLIERFVPLVTGTADCRYSPWQARLRPTQGLLHGLYVFRVIQEFLAALPTDQLDAEMRAHIQGRIDTIECECRQLDGLDKSQDLTDDGSAFVSSLL